MATALKTLVIVEDDHETRVALRRKLEAEGYFVFSAANGRQGLELLKRIKRPCVILADLVMPVMGGEEFASAVEADPDLQGIPMVWVTAYPDKLKASSTMEVVRKPIDAKKLLDVVKKHCGHD